MKRMILTFIFTWLLAGVSWAGYSQYHGTYTFTGGDGWGTGGCWYDNMFKQKMIIGGDSSKIGTADYIYLPDAGSDYFKDNITADPNLNSYGIFIYDSPDLFHIDVSYAFNNFAAVAPGDTVYLESFSLHIDFNIKTSEISLFALRNMPPGNSSCSSFMPTATATDGSDWGATSDSKTWYLDFDGDAYGDPSIPYNASFQPFGYVLDNSDCDDADPSVNPGATEIAGDNIDQDCDGVDQNLSISSIIVKPDLSFKLPGAIYKTLLGEMKISAEFSFYGDQNGQLLWKLADAKQVQSLKDPVTVETDLSFNITDATLNSPGGDIGLWLSFKFYGDQSGTLLWYLENYGSAGSGSDNGPAGDAIPSYDSNSYCAEQDDPWASVGIWQSKAIPGDWYVEVHYRPNQPASIKYKWKLVLAGESTSEAYDCNWYDHEPSLSELTAMWAKNGGTFKEVPLSDDDKKQWDGNDFITVKLYHFVP